MIRQRTPLPPQPGGGVTSTARAWSPTRLGATWVYDPALLTVSGANITSAPGGYGGVYTLTAASGKEPVATTTGPFGKTAIRSSNTSTKLVSATGGVTGNQPWHLLAMLEALSPADAAGLSTCIQFGSSGPTSGNNVGIGATATYLATGGNGTSGIVGVLAGNPYLDTRCHLLDIGFDGTNLRQVVDGKVFNTTAKTYAITDAAFGILNWYNAYIALDARIHALAIGANKNFTQAEVNAFLRFEFSRLASAGGRPRCCVFFGDSTTAGTASGAEPLGTAIRATESAPNITFADNEGVSGERSDQVLTRILAYTGPATHMHIWVGVNHTLSPVTPSADAAGAYADILSGVAFCRARSIIPIVGTLPQWGAATTGSYADDYRIALNALILAGAAAGAFTVADISAAFGPYDSANFCADTLHENIASLEALVAPTIHAALIASS